MKKKDILARISETMIPFLKEYRDIFQLYFQSVKTQVDEGSLSAADYEAWTDKVKRFIELLENKYKPWYN